ncbi:MAG: PDZ domain-containing protein [Oligoflexia bacterium]|nr:PDZ domain-containing protein [Oligoflexia bacterium]
MRLFITTLFIFIFQFSQASQIGCETTYPLFNAFLSQHVQHKKLNSQLEERTITQYIKLLDPSKIYLLQSDVDKIKQDLSGLFEKVEKRECIAVEEAHQLFVKRVGEALEFTKKTLGSDFKFQEKTSITINPDKRVYAKDVKELHDLQLRYIQFQISNYLISDMKLAEAKKSLIHRYELVHKQAREIKKDDLYAIFLDAFASALDPHSNFMSKDNSEDFDIGMRLSLEGIGATLSSQDGYTVVENLVPGGPAFKSGEVEPKDKIIAVAQGEKGKFQDVIDMPLRDVVKLIRGKKGTKVKLNILRQGKNTQRLVVTITRDKIDLKDEAAKITYIDKKIKTDSGVEKFKIGVIDLPSFYADSETGRSCSEDVKRLVKEANAKKVDGLILDLSKNGGGVLGEAVKVAGIFIKKGNIVETQDADSRVELLSDLDSQMLYKGPLVVLTSRLSASASEIVAGALKDYRRAVIVGSDRTFGKGTVQQVMRLRDNMGAVKVTSGMFFIPSGNSTQEMGVESDITIPSQYSTKEFSEQALDYALPKKALSAFLSEEANGKPGINGDYYLPIEDSQIEKLKKSSKARVAQSKEFSKILTELKEAEEKNGILNLQDVMKKNQASNKERDKKNKRRSGLVDPDYVKQPAIQEASDIATDLIILHREKMSLAIKGASKLQGNLKSVHLP